MNALKAFNKKQLKKDDKLVVRRRNPKYGELKDNEWFITALGYSDPIGKNEVYVAKNTYIQYEILYEDIILTTKREKNYKKRGNWLYYFNVVKD